ncbi:hypothetical protein B0H63DRAFT_313061 [Podospora didyma]|uniref:Mid2 domain-containing protein n=1 Tax=Podospora didyma TaxID=330526 RepID=A0AAE0K6M6_9PEZI|nr:hypothetical protein B0H63DRAFT_313061 [Podospora didyma]
MAALVRILAAGWLLAGAAAVVNERFPLQAMETGPALSPRYYEAWPANPLGRRQTQCSPGNHPCDEIGAAGTTACCGNDQYCIINPTATTLAGCCRIGATCGPCAQNQVQCPSTTTITNSGTVLTSVVPACCSRRCTDTSMYGCPTLIGTGCCPNGMACLPGNVCASTVTPTSSTKPLVAPIPEGCTTSQIACPSSLGGGCCAVTQSCTFINNAAHCAEITVTPTGSGIAQITPSAELGTGAKAGIAVGVVVAAGLIIGAATWFCLRKRRRSETASSSHRPRPRPGALVGGREMSDDTTDIVSRGGPLPGMVHDYFGPSAVPGPYTETQNTSAMTTPGIDGQRGGVPLQPDNPDDIVVPIEIDSRERASPEEQQPRSPGSAATTPPALYGSHTPSAAPGRFELYGSSPSGHVSPNTPSPFTATSQTPPHRY